jgi:uncharacterized protein (UPF0276 family)
MPSHAVQEIHLAGYDDGGECLIDTHGTAVSEPVWALYREALSGIGRGCVKTSLLLKFAQRV